MFINNIIRDGMGESYLSRRYISKENKYKSSYESYLLSKNVDLYSRENKLKSTINNLIAFSEDAPNVPAVIPGKGPNTLFKTINPKKANVSLGKKIKTFAKKYGSKIREMIIEIFTKIRNFINTIWKKFGSKRTALERARATLVKTKNKIDKFLKEEKDSIKLTVPSVLSNPQGLNLLIKALNRGVEVSLNNFELLFIAIENKSDFYNNSNLSEEMRKSINYIKDNNFTKEVNISTVYNNIENWINLIDVCDSSLYKIEKIAPRIDQAIRIAENKLKNKEIKEKEEDPEERNLLDKYRKSFGEMMIFTNTIKNLMDDITNFTNSTLKIVIEQSTNFTKSNYVNSKDLINETIVGGEQ